jgi:excisionase family DNA binding protein
MEDRWLSVDEITAYLGVSRDTIYNWISQKGLPAHRLGRLWKFKRDEVDAWVRQGGASEPDSGQAAARAAHESRRG